MTEQTAERHIAAARKAAFGFEAVIRVKGSPAEPEDGVSPDGVVPADLVRYLARLRLLEGVPFSYLVPDADLLPPESIRFFHLDRNWTDALVQGALAVGTVNSGDRTKIEQLHPIIRDEVDAAERLVRMKDADRPEIDAEGRPIGAGGTITGFLLRSRLVSGWPGLHVRAYATDTRPDDATVPDMDTSPDRVRVLRMERLAPAVLLVLFDGVPAIVHIEEPRSGIQFGVRMADLGAGRAQAFTTARNADAPNDGPLEDPGGDPIEVRIPFRPDAPGVINMAALEERLAAVGGTNLSSPLPSDELAIELLRFPIRQVFGDTDNDPDRDHFKPTRSTNRMKREHLEVRNELEARLRNR